MANKYYLIEYAEENLRVRSDNRLPTLRQILRNFVFYHSERGEKIQNAAISVIKNAMPIWSSLKFTAREEKKCVLKLIKEYKEWNRLSRYHDIHKTVSAAQKSRIELFKRRLDEPFDVGMKPPTKMKQSSSEEIASEDEETIMESQSPSLSKELISEDVEMLSQSHHEESQPGSSGQNVLGARKRTSAMVSKENIKKDSGNSDSGEDSGKIYQRIFTD